MGDRANVHVRHDDLDSGVYLYTHWRGSELPRILRDALARKERWNDCQYLTRIIFCNMIEGEEDGSTGFGISSIIGDGDSRILWVDSSSQTVTRNSKTWTFREYISLTLEEIEEVWYGNENI